MLAFPSSVDRLVCALVLPGAYAARREQVAEGSGTFGLHCSTFRTQRDGKHVVIGRSITIWWLASSATWAMCLMAGGPLH